MHIEKAIAVLNEAKVKLSDPIDKEHRSRWNSLMTAMDQLGKINLVAKWYAKDVYFETAKKIVKDNSYFDQPLSRAIEIMKRNVVRWRNDLYEDIEDLLDIGFGIENLTDGKFKIGEEVYQIVPVVTGNLECSFEIQNEEGTVVKETKFDYDVSDAFEDLEDTISSMLLDK